MIGGDHLRGWIWTCEEDSDPKYNTSDAWHVGLNYGDVYKDAKTDGYQVRLVNAFKS